MSSLFTGAPSGSLAVAVLPNGNLTKRADRASDENEGCGEGWPVWTGVSTICLADSLAVFCPDCYCELLEQQFTFM